MDILVDAEGVFVDSTPDVKEADAFGHTYSGRLPCQARS